jgi:hypothetical protein
MELSDGISISHWLDNAGNFQHNGCNKDCVGELL